MFLVLFYSFYLYQIFSHLYYHLYLWYSLHLIIFLSVSVSYDIHSAIIIFLFLVRCPLTVTLSPPHILTGPKLLARKSEVQKNILPKFFFTFPHFLNYPINIQNERGSSPVTIDMIDKGKKILEEFKNMLWSKMCVLYLFPLSSQKTYINVFAIRSLWCLGRQKYSKMITFFLNAFLTAIWANTGFGGTN